VIEAKQLNEGNSVLYNGAVMKVSEKRSPKPLKDEKYSEKYVIELFDGAGLINCTLEEIEPIPITEDVLLEYGFKKNERYCYVNISSDLELMNIGNKYFRACYSSAIIDPNIIYLHQLQNLYFALTNQELKKIEK
jgi:hypothetical protein